MGQGRRWGKWLLLGILAVAIGIFFALDLGRYLSFEALNANKARLLETVSDAPVASAAVFVLVYVSVTALSLPVATALTILSGALFGRVLGTALVNVAATTGATLAFLAARYLFGEWAQRRMSAPPDPAWDPEGPQARRARSRQAAWQSASAGIQASGLNYLLVLRLIPVVPFFLINLVSGVSPLPVRSFILGTLVGTLPGTFLYVNAGTALGTLSKPSDLLSFQVVGALSLLALFSLVPVAWRRWRKA